RREAQLADKARVLAEKVQASGREIRLEPLHAHDRRVVHTALTGMSGIRTYTAGQGLHRSVVIAPRTRGATHAPRAARAIPSSRRRRRSLSRGSPSCAFPVPRP